MRKTTALLAMAGLMTLAACHGKDEGPPPADNDIIELDNNETQPPEAPPVIEPEAPTNNVAEPKAPPPPPKVSEDQQMLDDADATGLTSRLPDNSANSDHGSAAQ